MENQDGITILDAISPIQNYNYSNIYCNNSLGKHLNLKPVSFDVI